MIFIGLGSSIGNAEKIFQSVEKHLLKEKIQIIKKSKILKNPPYGKVAKNEFTNTVWQIKTDKNPNELIKILQKTEKAHGRTYEKKWADRTLDLDILIFRSIICNSKKLTIPHPEISKRIFVLKPLSEIVDEEFEIPGKGRVKELLENLTSFTALQLKFFSPPS